MSTAGNIRLEDQPIEPKPDLSAALGDQVVIRPYPKIIIYYPTMIAALVCGLVASWFNGQSQGLEVIALAFFTVFFVNTVIVAFDFPQWAAIAVVLLIAVVGLATLLIQTQVDVLGPLVAAVLSIRAVANERFYFASAGALGLVLAAAWLVTRFDYWVVTNNEILHRRGIFPDIERFPAPQLKFDKEIADVFEYVLFRSGRLVLYPTSERRALILDNVMKVNRIEKKMKTLLEAMEVRIDRGPSKPS